MISLVQYFTYIMYWFFGFAQCITDLTLTTLTTYVLAIIIFNLNEFIHVSRFRKRSVSFILDNEIQCNNCKRKVIGLKCRIKSCNHVYCEHCFMKYCHRICKCEACYMIHIDCRLCPKIKQE